MPDYRISKKHPSSLGLTLLELMVAMTIASVLSLIAYRFYKNHSAAAERQRRISWLQTDVKEATESINRYLVGAGVAGDSVFFDPWKIVDGVKSTIPVYRVSPDAETLSVYGNFGRGVVTLSQPVLNLQTKTIYAKKASKIFVVGDCIFFNAGGTQEVNSIKSIPNDSTLLLDSNLYIPYPKGTIAFPLERIKIHRASVDQLNVNILTANKKQTNTGKGLFLRSLHGRRSAKVLGAPQDSVFFKVLNVSLTTGQIQYSLRYSTRLNDKAKTVISRGVTPTVFVRGF